MPSNKDPFENTDEKTAEFKQKSESYRTQVYSFVLKANAGGLLASLAFMGGFLAKSQGQPSAQVQIKLAFFAFFIFLIGCALCYAHLLAFREHHADTYLNALGFGRKEHGTLRFKVSNWLILWAPTVAGLTMVVGSVLGAAAIASAVF